MSTKSADRAAAHEKGTRGVRTAAAVTTAATGVAVAAAPVFAPIALIVGGSIALGLTIAAAVRDGEDRTLRGDKSVIAEYIKKSAGWSREKRKKEAEKLLKAYQKHKEKGEKRYLLTSKKYKDTDAWIIAHKKLKWKLLALHVNEVNAKAFPNRPLVKGKANTAPALADRTQSDDSSLDDAQTAALDAGVTAEDTLGTDTTAIPWTPILIAGGVGAVLFLFASRPQAVPPRAEEPRPVTPPPLPARDKGGARA